MMGRVIKGTENMVRVWEQDDAIPQSHPEYETPMRAYLRIAHQDPAFKVAPMRTEDRGDNFLYFMPDGWIVYDACDGGAVYKPMVPLSDLCFNNVFAFGVVNTFLYTNDRGEKNWRRAIPLYICWDRHSRVCPESKDETDQWLMVCFDLDKNAIRHFALKDIEPR